MIDADFIALIEANNSWIIYDTSENYGAENHHQELRYLMQKSGDLESTVIYIQLLDSPIDFEKLSIYRKELIKTLIKYKVIKNIYNIDRETLSSIVCDFIKKSCSFGISNIAPIKNNLIPINFINQIAPLLRQCKEFENKKIYEKWLPDIMMARKLFSSPQIIANIKLITERIYLEKEHKFVHSFFDSNGKRIRDLFEDRYKWYPLPNEIGASLMVALGAFGYNDHKAILFLAFQRLHQDLSIIEGRKDWRVIDNKIPPMFRDKLTLLSYFASMTENGYFKNNFMLESIPLAEIIPDGLYFFDNYFNEEVKYHLETFYPNIKYKIVNHKGVSQPHQSTEDFIASMPGLR